MASASSDEIIIDCSLHWALPSVSCRHISKACNSPGVSYISRRFSVLGRRMILGFHFDPTTATYVVEVRATTTTMAQMIRRWQLRQQESDDPFTTPRKSSMTNGPAYPFPYYTVTIGRKEEAIDSTQVQGEEEGDDASTTSGSPSPLEDLVFQCSCDDRRPGLCKHAALVARLLLLPTSDPQPPRVGVCVRRRTLVDDEEKETSPEGGYKTSESAARLSTAASAVEESTLRMVNEDTSQHVVRVAPEAWSPHLPGMRLRQVEVRGEAICSLLMKLPDDASTAEVVMAICSSCTSPTELNQDPGDWCIHVEAAVKILEQERARNSQGETTCVAVSSSTVVDPRPTDIIAKRLVFTSPTSEGNKGAPSDAVVNECVPLVVIDDADLSSEDNPSTPSSPRTPRSHGSPPTGTSSPLGSSTSSSSCRKRRRRSLAEISSEVAEMALRAAGKVQASRNGVGKMINEDAAEEGRGDRIESQTPDSKGVGETPASFQALLRRYL